MYLNLIIHMASKTTLSQNLLQFQSTDVLLKLTLMSVVLEFLALRYFSMSHVESNRCKLRRSYIVCCIYPLCPTGFYLYWY